MRLKLVGLLGAAAASTVALGALAGARPDTKAPRAWDDAEIAGYRLPLAGLGKPPTLISAREYYALPENNLKTYPVYTPDKEPPGYLDMLKSRTPQPMVDVAKLKTEADWIAAGRELFYGRELPRFTGSEDNLQIVRNPEYLRRLGLQTTKDGVILGLRYVVRETGKVELGTDTCAMCHVQVLPDGRAVEGAPNNRTPFGPIMGGLTRRYAQMGPQVLEERRLRMVREDYRVPYLADDPNLKVARLPVEELAKLYDRHPLGTHGRTNTSLTSPVKIANLIGIKDLRYLDRTATTRQRSIRDLMRYCALVGDSTDALTRYGDGPTAALNPQWMGLKNGVHRSPDPLLYALAKFIYSLGPPANPHPVDGQARRGAAIFRREKCVSCHTPPLYTNNKVTLARGFEPSEDLLREVECVPVSVGTDPSLAMATRKGTGIYRVPSLRMLWLYACFLHDGSVGSLEELFDPKRLTPAFHSSNWPADEAPHAVEGHPFGTTLTAADKADLIAFLRTL